MSKGIETQQPPAVPSLLVPPHPSERHIWDSGTWRPMTAGEAVYLRGEAIGGRHGKS